MAKNIQLIIEKFQDDPSLKIAGLYEDFVSRQDKSLLGQFFTPPELTHILNQYAIQSPEDEVLEPTAGCGSIASIIVEEYGNPITCVDIDPDVIELSKLVLKDKAEYHVSDILAFKPDKEFDAIISNLPFISKTKTDRRATKSADSWKHHRQEIINDLKRQKSNIGKISLLSDLYVLCILHCTQLLKNKGRLAVIVSGGWITAEYGAALKSFLLGQYKIHAICESAVEHWFPDTQVNACMLLLEKEADKNERAQNKSAFVKLLSPAKKNACLWDNIRKLCKNSSDKTMSVFQDGLAEYTIMPQWKLKSW